MNAFGIFLLVLFVIWIILFTVSSVILYIKYKKYKDAILYSWFNQIYCGGKPCQNVIVDLPTPEIKNKNIYSPDLARYCADLVVRVEHGIHDGGNVPDPKTLIRIGILYNNPNDPAICYVWYANGTAWVVFRGTMNLREWMQDFHYTQNPLPDSSTKKKNNSTTQHTLVLRNSIVRPKIHSGFLEIYNSFKDDLFSYIKKVNPHLIVVTGHSLGAAMATLSGVELVDSGYKNTVIYNFASPKVGDKGLRDYILLNNIPHFRIVNRSDVIPTLPLSVSANFDKKEDLYFYDHCGDEYAFDTNAMSVGNNHFMKIYIDSLKKY